MLALNPNSLSEHTNYHIAYLQILQLIPTLYYVAYRKHLEQVIAQ